MASFGSGQPIVRLNFSKIEKIIDIPNLIDVQRNSYEGFLQKDIPPEERLEIGLQAVFKSVFPIRDFNARSFSARNFQVRHIHARPCPVRRSRSRIASNICRPISSTPWN